MITQGVIGVDYGTSLVLDALHTKDAISVYSDVYVKLQRLFRTVDRNGEYFSLFKARNNAQPHRFNTLNHSTLMSEAVSALFLVDNADVHNAQWISILTAAAPADVGLTSQSLSD